MTKPTRSAAGRVGAILQERDAVEDLMAGIVLSFRAYDGDVISGRGQRLALQPDPSVEGNRQVLDDDQDPRSGTSCRAAGHTAHPMPS